MKRLVTAVCATLALTTAAHAETQLEQLERLSETSTDVMLGAMVDMAVSEGADRASLEAALVPFEWNDAMREAGGCMLDGYTNEIGSDGVETMLGAMEDFLTEVQGSDMDLEEMAEAGMDIMPEGMTEDRSMEITQECGMTDLQLEWMAETGFMDAMFNAAMAN
ncbi:MAG: hypothetical protein AAGL89_10830 [Pseudomonadota bacterium]